MDRFRAAYCGEIEPMTDKTQWPLVKLPFVVGAPLAKGAVGRLRKFRLKGFMEAGYKEKCVKDGEGTTESEGDNVTAPTNAKR